MLEKKAARANDPEQEQSKHQYSKGKKKGGKINE